MAILINRNTRVITQGISGKAAQLHTRMCRDYGSGGACFVAAVEPHLAGTEFDGMPVYGSVREARQRTGATVSVIHAAPPLAAAAIDEAVDAGLELVICVTEGIPAADLGRIAARTAGGATRLLGPGSHGIITPGAIKIGSMPGHIYKKGRVGIVSRSATLAYEAAGELTGLGLGQSSCVVLGDDPGVGLQLIDVMKLFGDDPDTDAIIMIGETEGDAEQICARWVRESLKKPVVGFISCGKDGAREKRAVMEECGIVVAATAAEMGELVKSVLYEDFSWMIS
jgi:succinyl-CoA synthetase alpha subunit